MIIRNIENLKEDIRIGTTPTFHLHLRLLLRFLLTRQIYVHYNGLMYTSHGRHKCDDFDYKISELVSYPINNRKRTMWKEDTELLEKIGECLNERRMPWSKMVSEWKYYIENYKRNRTILFWRNY